MGLRGRGKIWRAGDTPRPSGTPLKRGIIKVRADIENIANEIPFD